MVPTIARDCNEDLRVVPPSKGNPLDGTGWNDLQASTVEATYVMLGAALPGCLMQRVWPPAAHDIALARRCPSTPIGRWRVGRYLK